MTRRRAAARLVGLAASATGLVAALRRRRHRRGDYRLFILEYHDVAPGPEKEGTVSTERFRRHLRYLKRHYELDTLAGAAARLAGPPLDRDLAVVSFDDGYAGNARFAWPVLAEEGATATIYLTTGFLDGHELWFDRARRALQANRPPEAVEAAMKHLKTLVPERRDALVARMCEEAPALPPAAEPLAWDDVRRMQEEGAEFGAHTVTHPILPTLPREEQEREIVASRERIAEETGRLPETFSYPNGDHDEHSVEVVRAAGFAAACTTRKGSNRPGADLFLLRRIGVGSDPTFLLAARLAGLFDEEVRRMFKR